MSRAILSCFAVFAVLLAGCQSARLGSKPIAYAPGADGTIGLVGTSIGGDLAADELKAGIDAEYQALELGETGVVVEWRGRPGIAGAVVPGPRYRVNDSDCRQFTHTVMIAGVSETGSATACRGSDRMWHLVG